MTERDGQEVGMASFPVSVLPRSQVFSLNERVTNRNMKEVTEMYVVIVVMHVRCMHRCIARFAAGFWISRCVAVSRVISK